MNKFWEYYKHPEWQKKRLEVLQRDGFECLNCHSKDKELHVHHGYYSKGKKPWEYPIESLFTLCADCHSESGVLKSRIIEQIGYLDPSVYDLMIGTAQALRFECEQSFDVDTQDLIGNLSIARSVFDKAQKPSDSAIVYDFARFLSEFKYVHSSILVEELTKWLASRESGENKNG